MIVLMKCLNEEYAVERVISDFHDEHFCSKIIVIDGGSTDYTLSELKRFDKVQSFVHPWLDWYHNMEVSQSNIALSYVKNGELVFILDFDERISPDLKQLLNDIETEGEGLFVDQVGHVARKTVNVMRYEDSPHAILGSDGWPIISNQIGQFPDYQCRLLKKHHAMFWINSPHHVLIGYGSHSNFPENCQIIHYEKDDARDRKRIEKKWLKHQLRRKELGLVHDVFETEVKQEVAEFNDVNKWDWRT